MYWKTIIIFLYLAKSIFSLQNITGSTGLITIPSAEILNANEYNSGIDFNINTAKDKSGKHHYKLNIGLIKNTEFGFTGGSDLSEGVVLNGKWNISSYSNRFPLKLSIGFENLTSNHNTTIYAVSSKKLRADLGIHAGINAKLDSKTFASLLLGIDYAYNSDLVLLSDISSSANNFYSLNAGIFYKILPKQFKNKLFIKSSILNILNNSDDSDSYLSIGFCYSDMI